MTSAPAASADVGHGVDEGDLGGEERVGGDLDQLGGGPVGDDDGGAVEDRPGVDGAQQGLGARRGDAEDEPVGVQGVGDGVALAQELRVPRHLEVRGGLGEQVGEAGGGADRDGGLADDQRRPVQDVGQGLARRR